MLRFRDGGRSVPNGAVGFLAAVFVVICSTVHGAEEGGWRKDFAAAEAEAKASNKPLLIHFHASWCGPCRKMDAAVLNTPELGAYLKDRVVGVKVDIDKQPAVADRFKVKLLPSDRIVSPEGKVVHSSEGYVAKTDYLAVLNQKSHLPTKAPKAIIVEGQTNQNVVKKPVENAPRAMVLAMEGYCPVTLWRSREWVKGEQQYALQYTGVVYYFKGSAERDEFQKNSGRYSPKFAGCDPVSFWETQRAAQGSPRYAAFFDSQLYLFENEENRAKFKENPLRYTHQKRTVQADKIESRTWH